MSAELPTAELDLEDVRPDDAEHVDVVQAVLKQEMVEGLDPDGSHLMARCCLAVRSLLLSFLKSTSEERYHRDEDVEMLYVTCDWQQVSGLLLDRHKHD